MERIAETFERLRSSRSRRNYQALWPRGLARSGKPATICRVAGVICCTVAVSVYNLPAPSPDPSSFGPSWLLPETHASEVRVLFDKPTLRATEQHLGYASCFKPCTPATLTARPSDMMPYTSHVAFQDAHMARARLQGQNFTTEVRIVSQTARAGDIRAQGGNQVWQP